MCVKASNMEVRKGRNHHSGYTTLPQFSKDLIYASCTEAHVKTQGSSDEHVSPMLKLHGGQPVMINDNIDVSKGMANGAAGTFLGVVLQLGITKDDLDVACIDGHRTHCASAHQVQSLTIQMMDGLDPRKIQLEVKKFSATAKVPLAFDGQQAQTAKRATFNLKLEQFPINIANARTVHKLQGRTIEILSFRIGACSKGGHV